MDYIENIKTTFNLWWQHKYLWILGIVVALFTSSSTLNSNNSSSRTSSTPGAITSPDFLSRKIDTTIILVILAVIILVALVWFVLSIYFGNRAKAGIIKSTERIYKGETLTLGSSWAAGNKYWFGTFLINFILNLPVIIYFVVFAVIFIVAFVGSLGSPNALAAAISGLLLFFCLSLCFVVIYAIAASVVTVFAQRELIYKDKGVMESMQSGFNYILQNFAEILVSILIMIPVAIVMAIVLVMIIFILAIPFVIVLYMAFALMQSVLILGLVLFIVLSIFWHIISSIITGPLFTFFEIYWSVVYFRINEYKKLT